ncbi:hypothetical protein [Caballeronia mineralivorans]|jgi:hypothetical protein|uniref:hypothetical protein n=1 Tax=Caballeronia mineralivorans TaxID=2010198 RepID=UPI0023F0C31F|nr:hypothetical protein [Caballeronia mineralivorans]MDB5781430.1 hypothetical protein [Caballeronia mineralivorans]MEA3103747.1 hypothetical protein [Caballeronia mineralivorans]
MAGYSRTPGVTADNNSAGNVEPGAGEEGGKIVVSGTPKDVVKREKKQLYVEVFKGLLVLMLMSGAKNKTAGDSA